MSFLQKIKFSFHSDAAPDETFGVLRFQGTEGLSQIYRFEIDLISYRADLDITAIMQRTCTFTIHREDGDVPFHGVLAYFEQRHASGPWVFYHAVLVPKLWWLTLAIDNRVFLDVTVEKILAETMIKGNLLQYHDFEIRNISMSNEAPFVFDYVCQYNESYFQFLSRWMEREGYFFYFDHKSEEPNGRAPNKASGGIDREVVVATNSTLSLMSMPHGDKLRYAPPSGLDRGGLDETVRSFTLRQHMVPQKVTLKDYWEFRPSEDLTVSADISPDHGRSEIYIYGDHYRTKEQGKHLASIRSESILAREKLFYGESNIPFIRPGYTFELRDHYQESFNSSYLTTEVFHRGSQVAWLVDGIRDVLSSREKEMRYENNFTAIPAGVQYRSEIKTPKPRVRGAISATVMTSSDTGDYAMLDEFGRYQVRLPFETISEDHRQGSAANRKWHWMRMAQPYAGTGYGMCFPLYKDTEVLLTFIDGDPDRPIISAAVPNIETQNVVNDLCVTNAGFKTAGGNQLAIQDKATQQRISMHAGDKNSSFVLGATGNISHAITSSDLQASFNPFASQMLTPTGATFFSSRSWSARVGPMADSMIMTGLKSGLANLNEFDDLGSCKEQKIWQEWPIQYSILLAPYVVDIAHSIFMQMTFGKNFKKWYSGILKKETISKPFGTWANKQIDKYAKKHGEKYRDILKVLYYTGEAMGQVVKYAALPATSIFKFLTYGEALRGGMMGYGVAIYAHNPSSTSNKFKRYFSALTNPKNASAINLGNEPDILLAAAHGKIDILAEEGVNLISTKEVDLNSGELINIHAQQGVNIGTIGDGQIKIDAKSDKVLHLEYGHSHMDLEKEKISLETAKKYTLDVRDAASQEADLKPSTSLELEKNALTVWMADKENKLAVKGTKDKSTITSNASLTLDVKDKLSVKSHEADLQATKIKIGSTNSDMEINGQEVRINGLAKLYGKTVHVKGDKLHLL